jgi:L-alanine-DL-glutamate epimerase-like enolase superfamily enzyme
MPREANLKRRRARQGGLTHDRSPRVTRCEVFVFRIPTDFPEADGTLDWDSTTLVLVEICAGNHLGIGFTYAGESVARVISETLRSAVLASDCFDVEGTWSRMVAAVRNLGRPGVAAGAISAVDIALWDLKSKLLDLPLAKLLGQARSGVMVYGSGGFTSYPLVRLAEQLGTWANEGFHAVKMKVGRDPKRDPERVKVARDSVGNSVALFVDAKGAHSPQQAVSQAKVFASYDVTWFEEPVSSDDLDGLKFVRNHVSSGIEVAAGEYGYDPYYFRRMLEARAVDVLQADATRCGGITGFMRAAALAEAFHTPFSAHTAPAIHLHPCCAAPSLRHLEYFHDHARIERMLFEGVPEPAHGMLMPTLAHPGLGIQFKKQDASRFEVG